jgi:hypothetical protein
MEYALAFGILISLCNVVVFFYNAGYLPPPFFHVPNDTFMDWYNTAFWAHNPGAYTEWYSVYPPLSFLFIDIFSNPACYSLAPDAGRQCDPLGYYTLTAFMGLNLILLFLAFRKDDRRTALPRAIALGIGMPALFAWERGNLVVPCFTFFILGHSRLLRNRWLKLICAAVTINFKPYLVFPMIGHFVRYKWRWLEGFAIILIVMYLLSYIMLGQGSPGELLLDLAGFTQLPTTISVDAIEFASSYKSTLDLLKSYLPLMQFVGSRPLELTQLITPLLMHAALIGALVTFAGALWRPGVLTVHRLAGLGMALLLTQVNPGGYSEVFLIFFVFFERWRGVGRIVALLATYLLCFAGDYQFVLIAHEGTDSFLSSRSVGYDLGLTVGELVRPALVLIVEYALVATSLVDLYRDVRSKAAEKRGDGASPLLSAQPS